MDNRVLALIFAFSCGVSHAFTAIPDTPDGWGAGGYDASKDKSASYHKHGTKTVVRLNIGGKVVNLGANIKYAATAGKVAAGAVMLHPGLRTVGKVASWLGAAGLVYDVTKGLWTIDEVPANDDGSPVFDENGYFYQGTFNFRGESFSYISGDKEAACAGLAGQLPATSSMESGNCYLYIQTEEYDAGRQYVPLHIYNRQFCYESQTSTPYRCEGGPKKTWDLTNEEALDLLAKEPMPEGLPLELPVALPVEEVRILPVFVPMGDPVPNPEYQPAQPLTEVNQPYKQPGVMVEHAPTEAQPWQVQVKSSVRFVSDAKGQQNPTEDTNTGTGTGTGAGTDSGDGSQKADGTGGLCEQFPDILACQKVIPVSPEGLPGLPEKAVDVEFSEVGGFQGSAVCPAFPHIEALPGLSWVPFCEQLARIRPLVIVFGWVTAVFIIARGFK